MLREEEESGARWLWGWGQSVTMCTASLAFSVQLRGSSLISERRKSKGLESERVGPGREKEDWEQVKEPGGTGQRSIKGAGKLRGRKLWLAWPRKLVHKAWDSSLVQFGRNSKLLPPPISWCCCPRASLPGSSPLQGPLYLLSQAWRWVQPVEGK